MISRSTDIKAALRGRRSKQRGMFGAFSPAMLSPLQEGPLAPDQIAGLQLWLDAQTGIYKRDDAAKFTNANSEYLSAASNSSLQHGDIDFTWAGWVKFDNFSNSFTLVAKDSSVLNREFQLAYTTTTTGIYAQVFTAGNVGTLASLGTGTLGTGVWGFLVSQYDAAANLLSLQMNRTGGASVSVSNLQAVGAAEFRLGGNPYSGGVNYLDGAMQNWGFWKRKLTVAELDALYNNGAGMTYADLSVPMKVSLISWWVLSEASGPRADSHGGNTLADNNTVTATPGQVGSSTVAAANGDVVARWVERSANASVFTLGSFTVNKPTLATGVAGLGGLKEAVFSTSVMTSNSTNDANPFTYTWVARSNGVGGSNAMMGPKDASSGTGITYDTTSRVDQLVINTAGVGAGVTPWPSGTYHVGAITWAGAGQPCKYYFDGPLEASYTAGGDIPVATTMILGGRDIYGDRPFIGSIVELVRHTGVLSDSDRRGLIRWLGAKYGIAVNP